MTGQTVKMKIIDNIMVAMSMYLEQQALMILGQVIANELVKINVEEITTLPAERKNDVNQRNRYIIELFKLKKRDLSPKTMDSYLAAIRRLVTEINTKSLDQMDETDIEWYLRQYEKHVNERGEPIQATTWNNERRFLSAVFTWMRKSKLIKENPVESIPPKKVPLKPIDHYSKEEMIKLRDSCKNIRERAIIEIFRSTGARVGEISEIKISQIDMSTGDIWIQGEKRGRFRTIYLDADARHYFNLYLNSRNDDSPYMITQSRKPHNKMSTAGIRSIFKGIAERAGMTCRVYPHKSRKTLGMTLKNNGVDIGTIQEIMGHSSPSITSMYYAQSTPQTLRYIRERAAG